VTMVDNGWHDVAAVDELAEDDVMQVTAGQCVVALYRVGDAFYATEDCCTHQEASLSDGYLQDDTIECPRHQGVFHIPTGRAMEPPVTEDLRVYPVRVEGERVWVQV
jgi:nitrite reductase/ring-hydroxylating ferredoxin subunit